MDMQRLRPMNLGDIFDEGFDLYKKNFLFLVLVTAIAAIPLKILVGVISFHFLHGFLNLVSGVSNSDSPDPTQIFAWLGSLAGGASLLLPFYLVFYGLEMTALASATAARYLGEKATVWSVYRGPLRRLLPLTITALVFGLAFSWGVILCGFGVVLSAIIASCLFTFTAHAFALEGKAYFKALGRSSGLVSGYGGQVFSALFMLSVLSYILVFGMQLPFNYALETLLKMTTGNNDLFSNPGSLAAGLNMREQIVNWIGNGIAELLITPFLLAVLTVLYYDLRIRKEAFDIELLARDLGYPALSPYGGYLPPAEVFPHRPIGPAPPPARVRPGGMRR